MRETWRNSSNFAMFIILLSSSHRHKSPQKTVSSFTKETKMYVALSGPDLNGRRESQVSSAGSDK